jgi:O-acetyl-ADP-ribose deacetylase (regulator of RNase III)
MTDFIVRDDIFAEPLADVLVNPVNCQGVMGAGLAVEFKRRWPEMFADYKFDCELGLLEPGALHLWSAGDPPVIVNLPTKVEWQTRSAFVDVAAGVAALREILSEDDLVLEGATLPPDAPGFVGGTSRPARTVAVPALGCGLGGLDWALVEPMIRKYLDGLDVEVWLFPPRES